MGLAFGLDCIQWDSHLGRTVFSGTHIWGGLYSVGLTFGEDCIQWDSHLGRTVFSGTHIWGGLYSVVLDRTQNTFCVLGCFFKCLKTFLWAFKAVQEYMLEPNLGVNLGVHAGGGGGGGVKASVGWIFRADNSLMYCPHVKVSFYSHKDKVKVKQ